MADELSETEDDQRQIQFSKKGIVLVFGIPFTGKSVILSPVEMQDYEGRLHRKISVETRNYDDDCGI